jgi:hypothetical protein
MKSLRFKVQYTTQDGRTGERVLFAISCEEAIRYVRRELNEESITATCREYKKS